MVWGFHEKNANEPATEPPATLSRSALKLKPFGEKGT